MPMNMRHIKSHVYQLCKQYPFLARIVLAPYSNYCEKRRVRQEIVTDYRLNDTAYCLRDIKRLPGVNFWFLLEQGHNNIGDIAIGVAERRFFEQNFPDVPMHFIYEHVFAAYQKEITRQISPGDVIVLRGGGSIGNTIMHERHREEIIRKFTNNLIVSMPQTMCFADTEKGRREKSRAAEIYTGHQNLLLIAREEKTYLDMKVTFPKTDVLLTPDVVMTMDYHLPKEKRDGILLCFRSDWEKALTTEDVQRIEATCKNLSCTVERTDMYADCRFIPIEKREAVFDAKIRQFKHASLVITDRLHGMVFCAITGTPCIALSNYNHKVEQTYKWLEALPYVRYCRTVDDAVKSVPQMYNCPRGGDYSPEFTVPYYQRIADEIRAYCKRNG